MGEITHPTGPVVVPLQKIANPKGQILRAIKRSDVGFVEFGEAYFTTVHYGDIKGWKKHTLMQLNLVVPIGLVRFYVHDEHTGKTSQFTLGPEQYGRLTVPPGFWVAFEGCHPELNLVLNVASIEHDPAEAINVALETYPLECPE